MRQSGTRITPSDQTGADPFQQPVDVVGRRSIHPRTITGYEIVDGAAT